MDPFISKWMPFPIWTAFRLADREITTTDNVRETADEYDRDSAADFALWKRRPEDGDNFGNLHGEKAVLAGISNAVL